MQQLEEGKRGNPASEKAEAAQVAADNPKEDIENLTGLQQREVFYWSLFCLET